MWALTYFVFERIYLNFQWDLGFRFESLIRQLRNPTANSAELLNASKREIWVKRGHRMYIQNVWKILNFNSQMKILNMPAVSVAFQREMNSQSIKKLSESFAAFQHSNINLTSSFSHRSWRDPVFTHSFFFCHLIFFLFWGEKG